MVYSLHKVAEGADISIQSTNLESKSTLCPIRTSYPIQMVAMNSSLELVFVT